MYEGLYAELRLKSSAPARPVIRALRRRLAAVTLNRSWRDKRHRLIRRILTQHRNQRMAA